MDRRRFLAAAPLLALPGVPFAQAPAKVWRIGVLASAPSDSLLIQTFRQGLVELGYVDGRNITFEYKFAAGQNEVLPRLAAELVRSKVDLIVTDGNAAVHAAKEATRTIPIVMGTSGDPISSGAVVSLSRPGGNVTGLTLLGLELSAKKLELIGATVPRIQAIALLINPTNPQAAPLRGETEAAARSHRLHLVTATVANPREIDQAIEGVKAARVDAMITMPDAMFWNSRQALVDGAGRARLPAIFPEREFVEAGG